MMTKRLVPLLVLAITLTIAPAALASHCFRCHPITGACVTTLNYGFSFCGWDASGCYTENFCGNHLTAAEPLAAEFTVASVERLDGRQETPALRTLIASVETPASEPAPAPAPTDR